MSINPIISLVNDTIWQGEMAVNFTLRYTD
jgi:hypothetical protein